MAGPGGVVEPRRSPAAPARVLVAEGGLREGDGEGVKRP